MVFDATFNNISVISRGGSVFLLTGVPIGNHRHAASQYMSVIVTYIYALSISS
jgi:hypothetical protein